MGTFIMTSQSYILTLFDEGIENKWERLHDDIFDSGKVLYIGSQLEKSPLNGKLHWQAFCKFHRESKQRGTWFKKFANGMHFAKCSTERAAAINYGIKEETRVAGPKESGTKPVVPAKFTAEDCKSLILNGQEAQIPFDFVLRYNLERRLTALKDFLQGDKRESLPIALPNPWGFLLFSRKNSKQRHYWIYSRTPNKGKTFHFAKPLTCKYKCEIVSGDFTYFNITSATECVIFDEYNSAKIKWDALNAMCDGSYAYRRIYQASVVLKDALIIILSNQSIDELYPFMNQFIHARMKEIEII